VFVAYIAIALAQAIRAGREQQRLWMVAGPLGSTAPAWPLSTSLFSTTAWPEILRPAVVILWMVIGAAIGWSGRR
jgi:short subunit dehydrogenase-like uncharacterized protein